jgi:hypothetical protein
MSLRISDWPTGETIEGLEIEHRPSLMWESWNELRLEFRL